MRTTTKILPAAVCAVIMASGQAATIDGIRTVSDGYTGSFQFDWWNNHETANTDYPLNGGQQATAYYDLDGTTLSLYMEVPAEAKNGMWGTALEADPAEMDAYFYNNDHYHHGDPVAENKTNYKTQTESEHFQFQGGTGLGTQTVMWDIDSSHKKMSTSPEFETVVTSLDWLLKPEVDGGGGCTEASCDRKDIGMAFEGQYTGFTATDKDNLIAAIQGTPVVLHMSDERQGPVSTVPIPAALPLFASALVGLVGIARRRKKLLGQ